MDTKSLIQFAQKRYIITGAASGLGRATSMMLSNLGAQLLLIDVDLEGLKDTARQCFNSAEILQFNLLELHDLKVNIQQIAKQNGPFNGFVHFAGKPYISPLKSVSQHKAEELFKLNTYSAIELAKVFTLKDVYVQHNGSIVLISSVYGLVGSAANVAYAMSKSALHGITKSLAIELSVKGIRVNCIAPGFIKTPMLEAVSDSFQTEYYEKLTQLHPLGLGEANDIASTVIFLLSDMAKWITGTIIPVDGGFTAQ